MVRRVDQGKCAGIEVPAAWLQQNGHSQGCNIHAAVQAFGTAAMTKGNWKGKVVTAWRNKGQWHPQSSLLGNWLYSKFGSSLHALHSKCCKTKPSDAFYFSKGSSFPPHPKSPSLPFYQCPSPGTCFHNANWWLRWSFTAATSDHQVTGSLLQALWGSRSGWQIGRQPAVVQTSLIPSGRRWMPLSWASSLPCG